MSDTEYTCEITLGGSPFVVSIDTGSADLWVYGSVPGTVNTTVPANLSYGIGSVAGFINTATLVFDDYVISEQAYLNVDALVQQPNSPGTGLIGLGPSAGSQILGSLNSSKGDTPLDRIFKQNTTTPNILTILLSRTPENSTAANKSDTLVPILDEQPGQITIGEVLSEYESITKQAKLPGLVDTVNQHWKTVLDPNGIIGPDGSKLNTVSVQTNLSEGQSDQLRVVFDSGFTRPQVPAAVTDAFYGRIPGATWDEDDTLWIVPCDYELNVTFIFGGIEYPIHPLDLTQFAGVDTSTGDDICVGWFQPLAENIATNPSFGSFDAILGMAFLRNVYLSVNYGDFVEGSDTKADPFIQLLSTLNRTDAHLDFVNTRLGGKDTTGSQKPLVPVSQGQTGSATLSEDISTGTNGSSQPVYKKTWFIVVVAVVGAIILAAIGGIIYTLTRRTRRSNVRSESAFVPPMGSYKPLIMKEDGAEIRVPIGQYSDHQSGSGYHDPYSDDPHGH
ncbi:acid protease [Gymnopus androsaceus JB14]|uniref:Acid protease n=1 Tax=Gymnopus androsaceus JB14 TaxID=1447944 RepID=A0A6A4GJX0_9AGAR|nr:acid protease [Gymnopus androsaceus JB14]